MGQGKAVIVRWVVATSAFPSRSSTSWLRCRHPARIQSQDRLAEICLALM